MQIRKQKVGRLPCTTSRPKTRNLHVTSNGDHSVSMAMLDMLQCQGARFMTMRLQLRGAGPGISYRNCPCPGTSRGQPLSLSTLLDRLVI